MPVVARGRRIIERQTGKVVGRGKTAASAKKSANVRNAVKHGWRPTRNRR